jgi:hypothetical protein
MTHERSAGGIAGTDRELWEADYGPEFDEHLPDATAVPVADRPDELAPIYHPMHWRSSLPSERAPGGMRHVDDLPEAHQPRTLRGEV